MNTKKFVAVLLLSLFSAACAHKERRYELLPPPPQVAAPTPSRTDIAIYRGSEAEGMVIDLRPRPVLPPLAVEPPPPPPAETEHTLTLPWWGWMLVVIGAAGAATAGGVALANALGEERVSVNLTE